MFAKQPIKPLFDVTNLYLLTFFSFYFYVYFYITNYKFTEHQTVSTTVNPQAQS